MTNMESSLCFQLCHPQGVLDKLSFPQKFPFNYTDPVLRTGHFWSHQASCIPLKRIPPLNRVPSKHQGPGSMRVRCWGSPSLLLFAKLGGSVLTQGSSSSSPPPLIAHGDRPNEQPVATPFPFSMGIILIGPFPGTDMKEKAICSAGFWLWD